MYPLRGIPQQRQLWSWISFDVANQSFTLIINTLLFSLFFAKVVVQNDAVDDQLWAVTYGTSMLLTAFLSPLLGAVADEKACKKACLIGTGLTCGILTGALALIQPGQIWLAMLLYIPANFAFQIGENFLASFLPALAPRDKLGLVSGFSWACSYGAALVLLILTAGAMSVLQLNHADQWRPFFLFSGLWFIVFAVPTMLWLREPEAPRPSGRNFVVAGFSRLADSLRHTAHFRDLAMLLCASLFYGTAMSVVIFFSSKLASEYGFSDVKLVLFVAVITVSGIFGTLLPMLFQDRFGHRRTTLALLGVWLFTCSAFALYAGTHTPSSPSWPLWVIGNLLGFGLGALGSANRAFVGYLAPTGRSAETFGLWGLTFKVSAIMTFPFAWLRDTAGTPAALLLLCGFVVIGFVLTLLIDEKRGHRAATEGQQPPAATPS